jgi:hypothetical protein
MPGEARGVLNIQKAIFLFYSQLLMNLEFTPQTKFFQKLFD